MSKTEIDQLTKASDQGDANAAFRLYTHYEWAKRDHDTALIWLKKSAQLGNPTAQYNLYYEYAHNPKMKDAALAKLWLKKAAANGNATAKKKLQETN